MFVPKCFSLAPFRSASFFYSSFGRPAPPPAGGGAGLCPSNPSFVRKMQFVFAYMRRNLTGDELAQLEACFWSGRRGAFTVYRCFTGHMRTRARHLFFKPVLRTFPSCPISAVSPKYAKSPTTTQHFRLQRSRKNFARRQPWRNGRRNRENTTGGHEADGCLSAARDSLIC